MKIGVSGVQRVKKSSFVAQIIAEIWYLIKCWKVIILVLLSILSDIHWAYLIFLLLHYMGLLRNWRSGVQGNMLCSNFWTLFLLCFSCMSSRLLKVVAYYSNFQTPLLRGPHLGHVNWISINLPSCFSSSFLWDLFLSYFLVYDSIFDKSRRIITFLPNSSFNRSVTYFF